MEEEITEELVITNVVFEEFVEVGGEEIIVEEVMVDNEEIIVENGCHEEDEIDVCNEDNTENNKDNIDNYQDNNYQENFENLSESNNHQQYNDNYNDNMDNDFVEKDTNYDYDNCVYVENLNLNNESTVIKNYNVDINRNNVADDTNSAAVENSDPANLLEENFAKKPKSNILPDFLMKLKKKNELFKTNLKNNNLNRVKITWQHKANMPNLKSIPARKIDELNSKLNFLTPKNKFNSGNISDNESEARRNRGRPKRGEIVPPVFKVTDCKPLDIAAHLNLLSSSLIDIGTRLKLQKGQVSVNGSVSVLLDSLVSILCPLLPLTSQIESLQESGARIKEKHLQLLDNIAYIMPGVLK